MAQIGAWNVGHDGFYGKWCYKWGGHKLFKWRGMSGGLLRDTAWWHSGIKKWLTHGHGDCVHVLTIFCPVLF